MSSIEKLKGHKSIAFLLFFATIVGASEVIFNAGSRISSIFQESKSFSGLIETTGDIFTPPQRLLYDFLNNNVGEIVSLNLDLSEDGFASNSAENPDVACAESDFLPPYEMPSSSLLDQESEISKNEDVSFPLIYDAVGCKYEWIRLDRARIEKVYADNHGAQFTFEGNFRVAYFSSVNEGSGFRLKHVKKAMGEQ